MDDDLLIYLLMGMAVAAAALWVAYLRGRWT